jgi:hypothetical protein
VLTVRFTNIFPSHGAAERALGVQAEVSDERQISSQWNKYYGCVKFPFLDQALIRDQFMILNQLRSSRRAAEDRGSSRT